MGTSCLARFLRIVREEGWSGRHYYSFKCGKKANLGIVSFFFCVRCILCSQIDNLFIIKIRQIRVACWTWARRMCRWTSNTASTTCVRCVATRWAASTMAFWLVNRARAFSSVPCKTKSNISVLISKHVRLTSISASVAPIVASTSACKLAWS